ncbi:MAG: FAD-dependent oxidoreductase [Clostridia bacterium]|nr:FAD-dependent oxidoreductase [Clostridia bacterium]
MSFFMEKTKITKRLNQDISADVCVIGGGMTGLLIAYKLRCSGAKVVVIEKDRLFCGESSRTTAKITTIHGMKYADLIKNSGFEITKKYYLAALDGMNYLVDTISELGCDCDLEKIPFVLYSKKSSEKLLSEYAALSRLNVICSLTKKVNLPFKVENAINVENAYIFNPVAFMNTLANELDIYTETKAVKVAGERVICETGNVSANHIIVATHYPFINSLGLYFAKMYQEKSYAAVFENVPEFNKMYYCTENNGYAFRPFGDKIIVSGNSHRTGKIYGQDKLASLIADVKSYYPNARLVDSWSAQDCMPPDNIPFIGRYSKFSNSLYVATGFGKWGMTSSATAALVIDGIISKHKRPYTNIFSPFRKTHSQGRRQIVNQTKLSAKELIQSISYIPVKEVRDIPRNSAEIVRIEGKKMGVYRDVNGDLHYSRAVCGHLGCPLTFNSSTKSWDCACHGSSYDIDGNIISNPCQK